MAGIKMQTWRDRLAERSDLTAQLVHLTRPTEKDGKKVDVIKVLINILHQKRLRASTTDSGFIVGNTPAVCFQDAPLYSITQNVYYEQKHRAKVSVSKLRYVGAGVCFSKPYVFRKGGRPVLYEVTDVAKTMLPEEYHWRIVRLDMRDDNSIVDWTHEREWRSPGDFEFDLSEVTVLLPNQKTYQEFVKICRMDTEKYESDILGSIRGIVVLGVLLY